MTIEEKRNIVDEFCGVSFDQHGNGCDDCIFNSNTSWCNIGTLTDLNEDNIDDVLAVIAKSTESTDESVNHPNHYNRDGSMECIDEMLTVFGRESVKTFCLLNVWKYRYRAADKNGIEDINKSDWYMNKYRELCSNE